MIPSNMSSFDSTDFNGNDGLCGMPLGKCDRSSKNRKRLAIIIAAGVFGALFGFGVGVWLFYFSKSSNRRSK